MNYIGDNLQLGHRVIIREMSKIGSSVRIGTLSDIQGYCEIEDYVNMHSNVYIGQKSKIKKHVWVGTSSILTKNIDIADNVITATGSIVTKVYLKAMS